MKTLVLTVLMLVLSFAILSADKYDLWQSFTSSQNIRYITLIDNTVHILTSGGWLKIDPVTLENQKIVNSDGIGTNDLFHIINDNNYLWVAGHGRLLKDENGNYTPYLFYDRNDNLLDLYFLADDNDQLWIGTSAGLARFSKEIDGGQIEDFYIRFGQLQDEPSVNSIIINNDTIWIATSDGLAFGDITDPNLLKSYVNWGSLKPENYIGMNQNEISALAYFNSSFYLGVMNGVYRVNISDIDTTLTKVSGVEGAINGLQVDNGLLHIYSDSGIFEYDGLLATQMSTVGASSGTSFTTGISVNNQYWVGTSNNGIYTDDGGGTLTAFNDGGLPGKGIHAIAANGANDVTAALNEDGLATFNGTDWVVRDISVVSNGLRNVQYEKSGAIWSGSWGGGLYYLDDDTTIRFEMNNSGLSGVPDADWYVVVYKTGLHNGRLAMVNYLPSDFNPVKIIDISNHDRWASFGINDGLPGDYLFSIDISHDIFVAGTSDNGVYYYYFGDDPFNKSDDSVILLNSSNSWLGSDQINSVKFDRNEILWVTTNLGISKYDPGIERFVNVSLPLGFGPKINCLDFDLLGNIWIGAMNGLGQYNISTGEIEIYTTLNSGLPDDEITSLSFDSTTLDLWIGTPNGLARLSSNVGPPVKEVENVIAFPNPYIITDGSEELAFNYGDDAIVRIYSVAGELVWENSINIRWNGNNQQGRAVAPGVYLFLLTANDGSTGKGKILLVRN